MQSGGDSSADDPIVAVPGANDEEPDTALKPAGSVCQGEFRRPEAGAPRQFSPTYTQQREARGIAIVGSERISARAFDIAVKTIERVFENNNLEDALAEEGGYVIIVAPGQGVLDLPEFGCLQGQRNTDFFDHVCGVADRADYPVATVNELDLLGNRSGPCDGLNILYHELGHLVQGWTLDHRDYIEVKLLLQAARDAGKYRGTYAATNSNEYFAEATQAYFLYAERDGGHDRRWLKGYDPALYELLVRIYGD